MSFTVKIADVDVVVAYAKREPKGLAKVSVQTIDGPEETFPELDILSSEAGIPHRASM